MDAARAAAIVLTLGDRPWWAITRPWLELYCRRWQIDLIVLQTPPIEDLKPADFVNFQAFGRAQKLGIAKYFDRYDRILQIDDTCMFSPRTPDLVKFVPGRRIGAWIEGDHQRHAGFDNYLEQHRQLYGRTHRLPRKRFFNSGVVVYSKRHAGLFDLSRIPWEKIKADPAFPQQGYLSEQAERDGHPLFDLGIPFNVVGSRLNAVPNLSLLSENLHVFHITSSVKDRLGMARKLDALLRQRYPGALAWGTGGPVPGTSTL